MSCSLFGEAKLSGDVVSPILLMPQIFFNGDGFHNFGIFRALIFFAKASLRNLWALEMFQIGISIGCRNVSSNLSSSSTSLL